jgi:hypothetical protein
MKSLFSNCFPLFKVDSNKEILEKKSMSKTYITPTATETTSPGLEAVQVMP